MRQPVPPSTALCPWTSEIRYCWALGTPWSKVHWFDEQLKCEDNFQKLNLVRKVLHYCITILTLFNILRTVPLYYLSQSKLNFPGKGGKVDRQYATCVVNRQSTILIFRIRWIMFKWILVFNLAVSKWRDDTEIFIRFAVKRKYKLNIFLFPPKRCERCSFPFMRMLQITFVNGRISIKAARVKES